MGGAGDLVAVAARGARVPAPQRRPFRPSPRPRRACREASAARARRRAARSPARCRRRRPPVPPSRTAPPTDAARRRLRGSGTARRRLATDGSRSQRISRSSDSGNPCSYASRPAPNTSRSTQGPPRPTPSEKPPAGRQVQQRGLLAEGHRVRGGQYADGRADAGCGGCGPAAVRGERDGRRAGPVRHEVVLGQPHRVEPGLLGHLGRPHRAVQRLSLALSRELGREYKTSYAHRTFLPPRRRQGAPPTRHNRLTRAEDTAWRGDLRIVWEIGRPMGDLCGLAVYAYPCTPPRRLDVAAAPCIAP